MIPSAPENYTQYEKLLVDLVQAGVDFAVVEGVAVSLNGFVRTTDDVDIIVEDSTENLHNLLNCLTGWGEGWAKELSVDDFGAQEGCVRVMADFDLDIFTRMKDRSYRDFLPRFQYFETGGVRIPYLSPRDLITLKEGSWREKEQLDVSVLRKLLKE